MGTLRKCACCDKPLLKEREGASYCRNCSRAHKDLRTSWRKSLEGDIKRSQKMYEQLIRKREEVQSLLKKTSEIIDRERDVKERNWKDYQNILEKQRTKLEAEKKIINKISTSPKSINEIKFTKSI